MKITLDCFHFKFYKDVSSRELPFTDLIKATWLGSQREESNDITSTMELQHVTMQSWSHGDLQALTLSGFKPNASLQNQASLTFLDTFRCWKSTYSAECFAQRRFPTPSSLSIYCSCSCSLHFSNLQPSLRAFLICTQIPLPWETSLKTGTSFTQ